MNPNTLPPEWFSANRVDTVYVATSEQLGDPLLTKFTGIAHTDFQFWHVQNAEKSLLLCGALEEGTVRQHYPGHLRVVRERKDILKYLRPFFSGKKVGLNMRYLTGEQISRLKKNFPRAKWADVSEALTQTREIKTREEISKIREAVKVTQETIRKIPNMVKPSTTEVQLAAEINYQFARAGCGVAFPTIAAFGKNSRNIHHFNGNKKIRPGETILIDCGAKYEGYCADLSRTFVHKEANEEQYEWYSNVVAAQNAGFERIIPGGKANEVQLAAEKMLGHKIPHALGHGIGLETHDVPGAMHAKAVWRFKPGMALAVEPGFYGKKWGIRVEDNAIVTKSGCERLSTAPKKLIEM